MSRPQTGPAASAVRRPPTGVCAAASAAAGGVARADGPGDALLGVRAAAGRPALRRGAEAGQAAVLLARCAAGAGGRGGRRSARSARASRQRAERQRAADLAALAGARALRAVHHRVFAPATIDGRPNPRAPLPGRLPAAGHAARRGRRRGATAPRDVAVSFPGAGLAPVRVRVTVGDPLVALGATLRRPVDGRGRAAAAGEPGGRGGAAAGTTAGRSPFARASRCARTSRWPSTAWPPRRAPTASR